MSPLNIFFLLTLRGASGLYLGFTPRRQSRGLFQSPVKIPDILSSSWGSTSGEVWHLFFVTSDVLQGLTTWPRSPTTRRPTSRPTTWWSAEWSAASWRPALGWCTRRRARPAPGWRRWREESLDMKTKQSSSPAPLHPLRPGRYRESTLDSSLLQTGDIRDMS